jgi:hypothetical protein
MLSCCQSAGTKFLHDALHLPFTAGKPHSPHPPGPRLGLGLPSQSGACIVQAHCSARSRTLSSALRSTFRLLSEDVTSGPKSTLPLRAEGTAIRISPEAFHFSLGHQCSLLQALPLSGRHQRL